tara:strand:- start:37 stop:441 length:405 start_codon:yes stop_codon:yes gene_type:complete
MIGRIAGAVMGGVGSLLSSKGEEDRGKDFFKSVAKGAITGPVGTGFFKGIKDRREFNQAERDETQRQDSLDTFIANQSTPVDLNQGNQNFVSPQQTPGTNGTAPANPVFNQGEYDKFNAIANQNYGAMFAPKTI